MKIPPNSVLIFTDGACTGNPGPGGYGSIISYPDGRIVELGDGVKQTTNNRMELAATIHALAKLEPSDASVIYLYTDSTYVIRGITQWVFGWRSRGWKTADGKDVSNKEHWEELLRNVTRLKPSTIEWKYVRGHSGYPGNERCDVIAVSYAKSKPEQLYVGPRDGYFVDLDQLPEDEPLPEQKPKSNGGSNGGGYGGSKSSSASSGTTTYLSLMGGVVTRYSNWFDCEKSVKGRAGAKFKKAKSAREEAEILSSWGLSPNTNIE